MDVIGFDKVHLRSEPGCCRGASIIAVLVRRDDVLTTATRADSLTHLKVFYYPKDIQKRRAMYLVNIIAALLDETALDAAERAEQISQEIEAAMPAGVVTIRDGEIWPHTPGPIPKVPRPLWLPDGGVSETRKPPRLRGLFSDVHGVDRFIV